MIRIALTKGRIEEDSLELLTRCGYDISPVLNKGRKLIFPCGEIEITLVKAADVITYVERGVCDAGIVGRDTIMEYGGSFYELLDLGFGKCRFAVAGVKGYDLFSGYGRKIIATKYPNVTKKYFANLNMDCEIVKIDGSAELAPLIGLADAIFDIVETGTTLFENGLEVYRNVTDISARCIVNSAAMKLKNQEINAFISRLSEVIKC